MTHARVPAQLETARLLLRQWRDSDLDAYAELLADPAMVRYLGDGLNLQVRVRHDSNTGVGGTSGRHRLRSRRPTDTGS